MKDNKKERSKEVVEFTHKKRRWLKALIIGVVSLVIIVAVPAMIDAYNERAQKRVEDELANQMEEIISRAEEKLAGQMEEIISRAEEKLASQMEETISSAEEKGGADTSKELVSATEEEKTVTVREEKDYNDEYYLGANGMRNIIILKNDVIQLYMSDDITDEQMQEYVEATLNIMSFALSDSEIPPEAIEKYNDIIKEIPYINWEIFQLQSTGENFRRGLKGYMMANSCWQIVDYYQEQIPEEMYNTFQMIVRHSRDYLTWYYEENCTRIIDYGRKLIEEYIGDPDEVLVSDEWRVFTGMPEK